MVYIGECEFCGKRNINPPNNDFFFTCHNGRTFVSCTDTECKLLHARAVVKHELKTQTFQNYSIYGADRKVKIPRSDGSVCDGEIVYQQGFPPSSCIMIRNDHIIFYTEFLDSEQELRCKHVSFGDLSRVNTHLPLVRITQSDKASNIEKKRLKKLQNRLNNFCVLTNRATRLVVMSHARSDGSFGCLPRELVSVILKHYYQ